MIPCKGLPLQLRKFNQTEHLRTSSPYEAVSACYDCHNVHIYSSHDFVILALLIITYRVHHRDFDIAFLPSRLAPLWLCFLLLVALSMLKKTLHSHLMILSLAWIR